jgi:hypothetical protein
LQQRQTNHAVAQMAAVFVVFSGLVGHPVGDFSHAEDRLVEFRLAIPILGHYSDVSYACKHGRVLLVIGFMSKLPTAVNQNQVQDSFTFQQVCRSSLLDYGIA